MPSGGKRPGAGRPKAGGCNRITSPEADGSFTSALEYLRAVALGSVEPDALRITAAKAILPFEHPKTRGPVDSPPPSVLARREHEAAEAAEREAWARKAEAIRKRRSVNG